MKFSEFPAESRFDAVLPGVRVQRKRTSYPVNTFNMQKLRPIPQTIAVWPLCVGMSILVVGLADETVSWRWSNERAVHRTKICVDKNDRLYTRINHVRYFLDEAMRIIERDCSNSPPF